MSLFDFNPPKLAVTWLLLLSERILHVIQCSDCPISYPYSHEPRARVWFSATNVTFTNLNLLAPGAIEQHGSSSSNYCKTIPSGIYRLHGLCGIQLSAAWLSGYHSFWAVASLITRL